MKWATRSHLHVDRVACAWLIRRFVDPEAHFYFIDNGDEVPVGVTPFDMRGDEISHHSGDCTFETILRRQGLSEPALWRMARVVHEADLGDERYDAPEATGLDRIIRGLALTLDDAALVQAATPIMDGLYSWFQAETRDKDAT